VSDISDVTGVAHDACELCNSVGGALLHQTTLWRVVLVDDPQYPGFCRVIWNTHVKEMSDLSLPQRQSFMQAVFSVEEAVRQVMQAEKINLASLGNVTPHLHWHIIPRFSDDAHFPQPVWGTQQRVPDPAILAARRALLPTLAAAVSSALQLFNTAA
jgi:diadenosine tetraphosphate (Ap4A) HIT family hydrolase